jgi:hypothetical protein
MTPYIYVIVIYLTTLHLGLGRLELLNKPEGRGSIPYDITGFSNLPNPSSRTMALASTLPLTEMSTRKFPGGKERPAHKADNLTTICASDCLAKSKSKLLYD